MSQNWAHEALGFLTVRYEYSIEKAHRVVSYAKYGNYLQIIYSFGIESLSNINLYFEEEENYEECSKIRDTVFNYNKATGTHLKLK